METSELAYVITRDTQLVKWPTLVATEEGLSNLAGPSHNQSGKPLVKIFLMVPVNRWMW